MAERDEGLSDSKLYFPVPNLKLQDLFDWSHPHEKCKTVGMSIKINEEEIALFRIGLLAYAVKNRCPHAGAPLHLGDVEELPEGGFCVRCPWHNWRINLKSGQVCKPRRQKRSTVAYPVRIDSNGGLSVGFDSFSPSYFNNFSEL